MGRLKKFFFGGSSSKRNRRHSDSEPQAGPSSAPTPASPAPSAPTQSPQRKSRLRRSLSMKRLRRSFRSKADTSYVPPASKPHQWQQDEKLVRAGTCNFTVKYLGSIEVSESRGMQICEEAAKQLRMSTRKKLRAVLWVSSDGLRVVEEESKGLIVDQTIEKVSFCAPDRNNDKGFSYICRDGTTRRWLCHCFHSLREPGERLSHAVGCAFAACLERKQQRDKLCGVKVEFDVNKTSFTRQGSFRVATMTESMEAAEASAAEEKENDAVLPAKQGPMPHAIPRRHASSDMLIRQGSVRLGKIGEVTPFKRQLSLRLNELPSTLQRQQQVLQTHAEVSPPVSPQDTPVNTATSRNPATNGHPMTNGTGASAQVPGESISAACAQLSAGLFELSKQEEPAGMATPPPIPQRPGASVQRPHQPQPQTPPQPQTQHQTQISQRGQSTIQAGILQPEPGPIKQKNPWEGSPAAPAQPAQPTPPPRPKPTPGLTGITPAPGTSINPWVGVQPPQPAPMQSHLSMNPGLVNNPFGQQQGGVVNGQHMAAAAQVHGAGSLQNGVSMHPQPISANFNNANMAAVNQPYVANQQVAVAGGISGQWTTDLSRTLPQKGYSPNVSNIQQQQAQYDPSQGQSPANNPFTNAVKTFEINL
ncbi:protein numb-like [Diadema setosum]|uniref:protein numb-like n=1 Tax=Diadema setosum TaxID=31175 RepID=UPI003B3B0FA4